MYQVEALDCGLDILGPAPHDLLRGLGHDQRELLASVAADDIAAPDMDPEQGGDRREHKIPRLVPEGIVDALEVIEVDHDHRKRNVLALGPDPFALQEFPHVAA